MCLWSVFVFVSRLVFKWKERGKQQRNERETCIIASLDNSVLVTGADLFKVPTRFITFESRLWFGLFVVLVRGPDK